jgi:Glycosyl transferase family 2
MEIIPMDELTSLVRRIGQLEACISELLLVQPASHDDQKSSNQYTEEIDEKSAVIQSLLGAINGYRQSMLLNPYQIDGFSFDQKNNNREILLQSIARQRHHSMEREICRLKRELVYSRNRYRLIRYFVPLILMIKTFNDAFKPKIGVLYHHPPIPLQAWGTPSSGKLNFDLPTISIVTPSFGQGKFIARTIDSVLNQGYKNLEYFVQDGGSKDETVGVLKSYPEHRMTWVSEADTGQSQAINRAFKKTSGSIMAWLNSDDLLMPGTLDYVANYFAKNPEVDVVYGHRVLIDEQDREIGRWILPAHDDKVLSWADFVPQETLFWRRSLWDKVGGQIDESFRFAMDWDLLIRFRDAGARMQRLPFFLGAFRIHEAQKTSAAINSIGMAEMDRLRERCLGRQPSDIEIRSAIGPYMVRHLLTDFCTRVKHHFS